MSDDGMNSHESGASEICRGDDGSTMKVGIK